MSNIFFNSIAIKLIQALYKKGNRNKPQSTAKSSESSNNNEPPSVQLFKQINHQRETHLVEKFKQAILPLRHRPVDEQSQSVREILSTFEGMEEWDFVSFDSNKNIFELTQKPEEIIDCLDYLAKTFPDLPESDKICYVIAEVKRLKQRQANPIYNLNQKPNVIFKDRGLRLAVINELMYRQNKLKPRFDSDLFAEEYPNFHGATSEAMSYFMNLVIPLNLLNEISELHLDATADIYHINCFDWNYKPIIGLDIESGYIPISEQAVEDLSLLPNLKDIYISQQTESSDKPIVLPETFLVALEARKIRVHQ